MKPTKCPAREKKKEERIKAKKKREERRSKLSAHAETSQANFWHLDQKTTKCMTCKWLCGKFSLFMLDNSDQKAAWLASKHTFFGKISGSEWVKMGVVREPKFRKRNWKCLQCNDLNLGTWKKTIQSQCFLKIKDSQVFLQNNAPITFINWRAVFWEVT